uniref:Uncharacterized protein n=1 Tax=Anguilla anguilla TaxID=7936 RepID=A0A0E9U097_ANGAN
MNRRTDTRLKTLMPLNITAAYSRGCRVRPCSYSYSYSLKSKSSVTCELRSA